MSIEAMKQALEALETLDDWLLARYPCGLMPKEIEAANALRQAIATAVAEPHKESSSDVVTSETQEPVAWGNFKEDGTLVGLSQHPEDQTNWTNRKPLYTHPPQRSEDAKQPKADHIPDATKMVEPKREPRELREWVGLTDEEVKKIAYNSIEVKVARAIEAKLKEKNQ